MKGINICEAPIDPDFVRFGEDFGQRFIITIDTEEEFDWAAPLERDNHSLHSVPAFANFQQFCEHNGIVPVYLIDYAVANSPQTATVLSESLANGRAEAGLHLHPWLNPPLDEDISEFNSFSGNLPEQLERAKFRVLMDAIGDRLGVRPLIYRAGRYGVGPNSASILIDEGIAIDTSVRTMFDYSQTGGPNFRDHPLRPYWLDHDHKLMELPVTTIFWGPLRPLGRWLYPRLWRAPLLRGVFSRLGLLERIPLTPEGIAAEEAIRAIDVALDDGLPLLVFSFHSPSLAPGHTPYVREPKDLDTFYDWWRQVLGHLRQRNVAPASVSEILASVALA